MTLISFLDLVLAVALADLEEAQVVEEEPRAGGDVKVFMGVDQLLQGAMGGIYTISLC